MTDVWVPGIDKVINYFDCFRATQIAIKREADNLVSCEPKETAQMSDNLIRVAQEVPELQRLIERREAIRERIVSQCQTAGQMMDDVCAMCDVITDRYQQIVIHRYYFDCLTMAQVADHIPFHVRRCWQIRNDAFAVIAKDYTPMHTDL